MCGLGYTYHGENGTPGRYYFDRARNGTTIIHVHAFRIDSADLRRHIVFRDVLRREG